jgi:subtilase family serine protease
MCISRIVSSRHRWVVVTLVSLGLAFASQSASAQEIAAVTTRHAIKARHVPAMVANGVAAMTGRVDLQQRLQLAINLPLRNQAELTQLLHDLYDPKSPSFHQYLSVQDFTGRFGATAADYDAVVAWAEALARISPALLTRSSPSE